VRLAVWLLALGLLGALAPRAAHARADFMLVTMGAGFSDTTPVQPVGGNPGVTLGDQRRRALKRALEIWGVALDSPTPIVVNATFPDLSCTDKGAVLGQAYALQYVSGLPNQPSGIYFPGALANRIAGRDVSPGDADLAIELNSAIDTAACEDVAGHWYYGFDGQGSSAQNDLIQVALHELAHGLGFSSSVDPETGASQYAGGTDVFSAHIRDLDLDETWDTLSDAQRKASAGNVRRLVFDGVEARRAAADRLDLGEPTLELTPMPAGVSLARAVADVELTANPAKSPISAPLLLANPTDACTALRIDVRGAVVLLENGPNCLWQEALPNLVAAGAVGAVFVVSAPASAPSEPLDAYGVGTAVSLRALTVSTDTGVAIAKTLGQKIPLVAKLGGDGARPLGADAQGRPLLFASQPALRGSSLSHFDSIARPNLLMEAYVQGGANHDLDLTLAVLRDLGWVADCGNGRIDGDEQCDLGGANSDAAGAACRTNCRASGCGDGQLDPGEVCDDAAANSDLMQGACRTNCQPARCGDGVTDPGEACDQGIANSDRVPDACRTSCSLHRCGDGVVDSDESCDGTAGCPDSCTAAVRDAGAAPDAGITPWTDAESEPLEKGCALASEHGGWQLVGLGLLLVVRRRRR
jgi:hypothetical protein